MRRAFPMATVLLPAAAALAQAERLYHVAAGDRTAAAVPGPRTEEP